VMRADSESRGRTLQVKRLNGVLSANEWRALDNLDEIPHGDDFWMPSNMQIVGKEPDEDMIGAPLHTNGNGNGKTSDA